MEGPCLPLHSAGKIDCEWSGLISQCLSEPLMQAVPGILKICVINWSLFVTLILLQEFVDCYGTAGVRHIAFNTSDIISAVSDNLNLLTLLNCISSVQRLLKIFQ